MNCPRCPGILRTADYQGVEASSCSECMGWWFGAKELARLAAGSPKKRVDAYQPKGDPTARERVRKTPSDILCPACALAMVRIEIGDKDKAVLDRCAKHGVWLDLEGMTHLEAILARLKKPSGKVNRSSGVKGGSTHSRESRGFWEGLGSDIGTSLGSLFSFFD